MKSIDIKHFLLFYNFKKSNKNDFSGLFMELEHIINFGLIVLDT